jgi:hypothetical protein
MPPGNFSVQFTIKIISRYKILGTFPVITIMDCQGRVATHPSDTFPIFYLYLYQGSGL